MRAMSGEKRDISHPLNIANMTDAQLDKELERGYADMKSGNTIPAQKAFADLRAELKTDGVRCKVNKATD